MIVDGAPAFLRALQRLDLRSDAPATPRGVFQVLPVRFRVNPEPAADNHYMDLVSPVDAGRAARQAQALAAAIEAVGVPVTRFPGNEATPDDVFPNNVFATVPGRLIVGRMLHPSRRPEALRGDIREHFTRQGYSITDLSQRDCVAELTGPLVIDRARRIGYCGLTDRVDQAGLEAMHEAFELRLTYAFPLVPEEYHTNVVLSVLAGRACVLHRPAFADPDSADAIAAAYPGRALFLDRAEKDAFAANCIALTDRDLFMSRTGAEALRPESRATLADWGFTLHTVALDEIEKAGGSLRCMVAEVF